MTQRIKVLTIITRLDKGGSAEVVLHLCASLDRERFESVLVYGHTPSADYDCRGTRCVYVPALTREISPVKDIRALVSLLSLLNRETPDIVQTNSSKAGFLGRLAAWLHNLGSARKVKIVHMPHGHVFYGYGFSPFRTGLFILLEKFSAKMTHTLVAITEGEKKESLGYGIGSPSQWTIIHPGVECVQPSAAKRNGVRQELRIPEGAIVVGSVARLEPVKGIEHFIEAAGLIEKDPPAEMRYLVVGDGSRRAAIESRVKELGIGGKFIFTGMSGDVAGLMSAMDVYVQPSLNEGMGKTLVQAHACGLPIVASKVQGIPDIVLDGRTGFLVPPASSADLAAKILVLAADPALRRNFGQAGREWVNRQEEGMACFGEERAVRLFEKLFEELVH